MLSKLVCLKCRRLQFPKTSIIDIWVRGDDDRWLSGVVLCTVVKLLIAVDNKPPKRCPYKLEHAVFNCLIVSGDSGA